MPSGRIAALIERLRIGWRLSSYSNRHFLGEYGPGHFYSPLPAIDDVRRDYARVADRGQDHVAGIDLRESAQLELVQLLATHRQAMPFPHKPEAGSRYHLDNPFFSFGDGVMLWLMLANERPSRVVEVGSGYSSAAMLDAADALALDATQFVFIDPYPERLLALLSAADEHRCRVIEQPLQAVAQQEFDALEAGDLLFIDSSHVAKFGSDVNDLFVRIIPQLKPGVLIHVHDICWPFDYPQHWFDDGRAWNEAYLLRAFLQFNDAFEIVMFNDFLVAQHRALIQEHLPLMLEQPSQRLTVGNSSLWFRRRV